MELNSEMKYVTLLLFLVITSTYANARVWTNNKGQQLEAELVEIVDDSSIKIRSSINNRFYDYKISNLSKEDQAYIKELIYQKSFGKRDELINKRKYVWNENFNKSIVEAKKLDLPVLLLFTMQSDGCNKLEDQLLNDPEFKTWAKQNLVLVKIKSTYTTELTRSMNKQNSKLYHNYGIGGYPTLLLIDKNEQFLGRIDGYSDNDIWYYINRFKEFVNK